MEWKAAEVPMAATYEPDIIRQHAQTLYRRADEVRIKYAILSACFFAVVALFISIAVAPTPSYVAVAIFAVSGAGIGWATGSERSFQLQLQAQTALCQLRIEQNTRMPFGEITMEALASEATAPAPEEPEPVQEQLSEATNS
jgi:hypothetical protein